jgi:hypothetical protein
LGNKSWLKLDYGLLLALILPLFAIMPLLTHAGLPNTADGPAHLMRQVELHQAWQEGNFYPRWGTDLAFGHGMPIFSYAPPALYHLTQFFHLFGLPLDEAMKAVLIFDFLMYSLGMFLFARRLFGPGPALVSAALYVYAPYRLREAYIQGNYGQFTGLVFYPFILWAFHGLITTRRPGYLAAAAVALAGLLFSHNISFMLFAPILAAYLPFLLFLTAYQTKKPTSDSSNNTIPDTPPASRSPLHTSRLIPPFAAVLLGLGLAAIFWLPAFGERHDIQLEGITQGFFDFRENFISLSEFFSPPRSLDLAAINPEFPFSLGLPQILGAILGLFSLFWFSFTLLKQRPPKPANQRKATPTPLSLSSPFHHLPPNGGSSFILHPFFFTFFLCLYAFLALPQSQPVWEAIPMLALAEFPWRMLGPAIFCASLLAGFGFKILDLKFWISETRSHLPSPIPHLSSIFHPPSSILYPLSSLLAIALNLYYLYPSQFIVWGTPTPVDAFAYEVTSGAIGTTSTGEFLPRSASQHPTPDPLWPDYAAGRSPQKIDLASLFPGATVEILSHQSESDTFRLNTPEAFKATLRTLYWPGWQIYLNGQPAPFTVTEPTGLIQTDIPPGEHTLTLTLESTPLRTLGQWLTIASAVILIVIIAFALKQRASESPYQPIKILGPSPTTSPILNPPSHISPLFFLLTTALLISLYLLSRPLAPLFTRQSNPDRPQPADQILQIDFGRSTAQIPLLRLVGLNDLPQTLALPDTGETEFISTLYWRALLNLETNYSVFLHLDAPNGQTFATADEANPENIPTRNWPPGLYLRNPLRLQIPANIPPSILPSGKVSIRPIIRPSPCTGRLINLSIRMTLFLFICWMPAASCWPKLMVRLSPACTL